MAKEMEAKVKINDPRSLKELVKSLGGKLKYAREEMNIFYDTSKRLLDRKGEVLRLRKELYVTTGGAAVVFGNTEAVSMTFKGKRLKGKLKIREENEFNVSDFEQARSLLVALGYKEYFRFEKKRESFTLDRCLIEFDTLQIGRAHV